VAASADGAMADGLDSQASIYRLYQTLVAGRSGLSVSGLSRALAEFGILADDPRISETVLKLKPYQQVEIQSSDISFDAFLEITKSNVSFIQKTLGGDVVIPNWGDFCDKMDRIFDAVKETVGGTVATYIPQLAKVSATKRAYYVTTISGQRHGKGDTCELFGMQSSVKPFTYALAVRDHGADKVHHHIGQEPSGQSFNEVVLNSDGLPHNPMINAGAIMACALLKTTADGHSIKNSEALEKILGDFALLTGGKRPSIDVAMATSEAEEAFRNFQLGYQMLHAKAFPINSEVEMRDVLNFYFQTCAIEMDVEGMSVLAATLANGGINPITNERVLDADGVKHTLSLMSSCGMYDYSGRFLFEIGLPAKSGVSGVVMAVIPNVGGVAIWSPPLDDVGNSVVGIEFCKKMVTEFNFHGYDSQVNTEKVDPRLQKNQQTVLNQTLLLFAAKNGDLNEMRRVINASRVDLNQGDYDDRTVLHVAASEGHRHVVAFLLGIDLGHFSVRLDGVDRWGNTALDDAKRGAETDPVRFDPVVQLLS
jgi:glutaminase